MTALCVIIGWVCKTYLTFGPIRVSFENVPILLTGIVLGPIRGALVGIMADLIACVLAANPINPIITLGAASVGIISGLFSHYIYNRKSYSRILQSVLSAHIIGSMVIKSAGLYHIYQYALELVALRVPLYIGIAIVESYFIWIILKNKKISEFGR